MNANMLRRLFPPPRLLLMEGGGVEISDRAVKYLALERGFSGGRMVSAWGEEPLPRGAVVEGDIRDEGALVSVLAKVRQLGGFSLVHASLPEQKGYLFDLSLPRSVIPDLADAVALQLPGYVPLPAADIIFDCEADLRGEDGILSVAVTAFPEALARAYASALSRADFLPLSLELEPQAAARSALPREGVAGAQLLIDYSAAKTMLAVSSRGAVHFAASFEGSARLDEALRARGLSETELFALKREEGVGSEDAELAALFNLHAHALGEELKRHALYWNASTAGNPARQTISAAYLSGGNANLRGLPEVLSRALNLPVSVADVWSNINFSRHENAVPPIAREESLRFATALGLAMRSRNPTL